MIVALAPVAARLIDGATTGPVRVMLPGVDNVTAAALRLFTDSGPEACKEKFPIVVELRRLSEPAKILLRYAVPLLVLIDRELVALTRTGLLMEPIFPWAIKLTAAPWMLPIKPTCVIAPEAFMDVVPPAAPIVELLEILPLLVVMIVRFGAVIEPLFTTSPFTATASEPSLVN